MSINQILLKDIFLWDVENWSKALEFWERYLPQDLKGFKVLELGCGKGGLSLYFAKKGANVICSDLDYPKDAETFHKKYGLNNIIKYTSINALNIPYDNYFDIICFKSVMGGVSRNGKNENKKSMVNQIYKALKQGGYLVFAENLEGSILHKMSRKLFVKWGQSWNYLKITELNDLFKDFSEFHYKIYGFLGAFGRNENQRNILGTLDCFVTNIVPPKWRYIVFGVAIK